MPTPLLELKNIGKIYVSEGNVAVGIRGVNLAFRKGEFVAVTGKSGSGKSTLLNVISGMDTYEEGEMFLEGEPTSHYVQRDWEEYRKQYISFIFQEYNIIESFTVLQNVELALMHISDARARREKALALLERVGLSKHIHHKGSKLSGGQKQRTVIARALAKDSPVILADEPTGNLDSQTAAEIIALLREVSKDKLVIVVTHNFEQVASCATRHIRIFDGAVESDTAVDTPAPAETTESAPKDTESAQKDTKTAGPEPDAKETKARVPRRETLRNGLHLGAVRFRARPKLTVFLCLLLTVSALAVSLISSLMADATGLFEKEKMFTHMDGRVVVARKDGKVMTDEELQKLQTAVGAKTVQHYDYMLDRTVNVEFHLNGSWEYRDFRFSYLADEVSPDGGRRPENAGEVLLSVPISMKPLFGAGADFAPVLLKNLFEMADYTAVGVHYFYDNTKDSVMYFTEEGYRVATAISFYSENRWDFSINATLFEKDGEDLNQIYSFPGGGDSLRVDFAMDPGTYTFSFFGSKQVESRLPDFSKVTADTTLRGTFRQNIYDTYYREVHVEIDGIYAIEKPYYDYYGWDQSQNTVEYCLNNHKLVTTLSAAAAMRAQQYEDVPYLYVAPDVMEDFLVKAYFEKSYTQASLFFSSDAEAETKTEALRQAGYVGVVSDETVKEDVLNRLERVLTLGGKAIGWVISVLFLTLFLNLCTAKSLNATKGDVGIMRSMGIPTAVIKTSAYVQMFFCLLPAIAVTGVTMAVLYLVPQTNAVFIFLHAGDYIVIALLLLAVTVRLSSKYVRRMFRDSVKKTLKGGNKG